MKDVIVEGIWTVATIVSILINFHLLGTVIERPAVIHDPTLPTPRSRQSVLQNSKVKKMEAEPEQEKASVISKGDLEALPRFNGMLTHVILEISDEPDEENRIKRLFEYWEKFPPCLLASHPTNWSSSRVIFTMLSQSEKSEEQVGRLKTLFGTLPKTVRACFKTFEILHAGLENRHSNANLSELRDDSRKFFNSIIKNEIGIENPNHVLYVSSECVPIQANWLNLVDYRTRPPNEPYWMLGSIFRGQRDHWEHNIASFTHIGRYAIYNFQDHDFREWYIKNVVPYVDKVPIPLYDFGRWEMDIFHYLADIGHSVDYQAASSRFRFTNTILNQWNVTINVPAIISKEPDVAIVCGIVPGMTKNILESPK